MVEQRRAGAAHRQFDEIPSRRRSAAWRSQIAHDRYRPGSVADKFTAANQRIDLRSARSRRRKASRTPTPSRRSTASTAFGSAISTSPCRSAFPASSTTPTSRGAIDKIVAAAKKHNKALGRLVPNVEHGHRLLRAGLRFHLLFGRCLGAAGRAGRRGLPSSAPAASKGRADDGRRKVPRRAVRRLQEAGRLADLSRLRPRAAAQRARASRWRSSNRTTRCAPNSSRISTR